MIKKVTYCILAYNQAEYIKQAVEGAFLQTYASCEIVISDDCSTDSTYEIIKEVVNNYNGPHSVVINRNAQNLGIGAHFSKVCSSFATGEFIVILGGDDISKPEHVTYAAELLERNQDVAMIDFNANYINSAGELIEVEDGLNLTYQKYFLKDYISLETIRSFAPGRIFRREVMSAFEPISKNCLTEDPVLVLRSLLCGGLLRVNEKLVYYRRHDTNISSHMYKLSNLTVVSQHLRDVLHYFNENKISEEIATITVKRILAELQIRKLKFKKYTSTLNKIQSILKLRYFLFKKRKEFGKFSGLELSKY